MDFPRLAKLSLPGVKEGEDILCCGELEYYDKTYDRVNVKSEKPLQRIDRIFHTVSPYHKYNRVFTLTKHEVHNNRNTR